MCYNFLNTFLNNNEISQRLVHTLYIACEKRVLLSTFGLRRGFGIGIGIGCGLGMASEWAFKRATPAVSEDGGRAAARPKDDWET